MHNLYSTSELFFFFFVLSLFTGLFCFGGGVICLDFALVHDIALPGLCGTCVYVG